MFLKANRKLSALTKLSRFFSIEKRRTLFKAFIESQFKYYALVWMFHGRQTNHKIKRVHERALRIVYSEHVSFSQDLLNKDNSFTIHHQNIQSLATETYETLNNLPGDTFEGLVTPRMDSYSLRLEQEVSTVLEGKIFFRYFGAIYEFSSK